MPRFLLKFKLRGRANRERPDRVVERDEVVLGSRPLADLYVPDRLVPAEALVFRFDGRSLVVEVKGRLAGVFVDGRPVEGTGPIRPGASVQAGHALVETSVDAAKGECTLTLNEQHLQQVVDSIVMKAKPERPFALVDPGPQEHKWGKTKVLRRANWAAAAAGALLLASFPFLRESDAMSRGELFHAHAIGAKDGPKACADCHAPFSSDYDPKCVACHAGYDGGANAPKTHPYDATITCSACHGEHVGAFADIVPSTQKSASGWPEMCLRCHAGEPFPPADAVLAKAKTRLRDERGVAFSRPLLVDGFSHADHRIRRKGGLSRVPGAAPQKGEAPVACAECHHELTEGAAHPTTPTAEFAVVSYEKCLECHADWRVPVHGRDEGGAACYQCHAPAEDPSKITAALRTADLPQTGFKWVLKPRGHDYRADECTECHVLERAARDGRTPIGEKVFRHDHHLRTVAPPPGGEMALSQECRACHEEVASSESLAGTSLVTTKACATCHTDGEPVRVEAAGVRRVTDMFHRAHTVDAAMHSRSALRHGSRDSLGKGCLSCHVPKAGEGAMDLREGAKDCKSCHAGHENVGQGRCVLCHVDRAPGKNRDLGGRVEFRFSDPGVFSLEKALTKTTAAIADFDHGSPGHAGRECSDCHDEAGVDRATRVLDVPWPAHDADACVRCHVVAHYHR